MKKKIDGNRIKIVSSFTLWDCGIEVPAWVRRPKNPLAEKLIVRDERERKLGIKYYIPAYKAINFV